jgi:phospholipid/cholesterol/gamma-HCH transport system substrate-binding protein
MSLIRPRNISELRLGTIFVIVAVLAGALLFQKQRVMTSIAPGETISADFAANHGIHAFKARVKIAGVPIGSVTTIKRLGNGHTRMGFKVKKDSLSLMGTAPAAAIRPTTLLGGNYYVDIVPGGRRGAFHGTIPTSRTELPVELDDIAAALNTPAREGLRSTVRDIGGALDTEGQEALQQLSADSPGTLRPAAGAFEASRGTHPGVDLPTFVRGFESTSRVLSEKNGQLDSSVRDLARLTAVLDARRTDMSTSLHGMPETLESTEKMLVKLRKTLHTLEDTSDDIRPSVRELEDVLDDLDPVLVNGRPVIADLRVVARDLRPVLDDLTPIVTDLTASLNNVRGPVLNRLNGQILPALNSGWEGKGLYAGTSGDHPMYEEIAYTLANLTQANMADANGDMVSFQQGWGPGSVVGLPFSGEQLMQALMKAGATP